MGRHFPLILIAHPQIWEEELTMAIASESPAFLSFLTFNEVFRVMYTINP